MLHLSESEFSAAHPAFVRSYETAREELLSSLSEAELNSAVSDWVRQTDRQFPTLFRDQQLHLLLSLTAFEVVSARGLGMTRAKAVLKLLQMIPQRRSSINLLQFALRSVTPPTPDSSPYEWWDIACELVTRHRLEHEPLGRFCSSLADLPRSVWDQPLETYALLSYDKLQFLPGVGINRLRILTDIFHDLYQLLLSVPQHSFLSLRFTRTSIMDVKRWIWQALRAEEMPSVDDLHRCFVEPIMEQIENDGGEELKCLSVKRAIEAMTLEEIASSAGVTRERIRQRLCEVGSIMKVRWCEGQYLLDDLLDKVNEATEPVPQIALVQNMFQLMFPVRRHSVYRHIVNDLELIAEDRSSAARQSESVGQLSLPRPSSHPNTSASSGEYINQAILDLLAGVATGSSE